MRKPVALLFTIWMAACSGPHHPMEIIVQGHRGCRGLLPENTIPALLHATQMGVSTLEFDVVATADGHIILSHDPFLAHEICLGPEGQTITADTEKDFNIYQMTLDRVALCNCGSLPHPRFPEQKTLDFAAKPTLSEAVSQVRALCRENNLPLPEFNIEIKSRPEGDNIFHPSPAEYVALFFHAFDSLNIQAHTTIQSFDPRIINQIAETRPDIRTVFLSEDLRTSPREKLAQLNHKPYGYSIYYQMTDRATVDYCRQNDIHLSVWTVNQPDDMQRMIDLGVTDIITDYPDRLLRLLREKGINQSHAQGLTP